MFSYDIDRALAVASVAHEGQVRKNSDGVPYFIHPVHVALMLARLGLDEVCIQAGILHDVVEDCDGWTVERVETEFGPEVSRIVAELSEDKSKTWEERKRAGIDHVAHMDERSIAVKSADKLHNLSCLLRDLKAAEDPAAIWSSFNGGRERTLAMAQELVEALAARAEPRMATALRAVVGELSQY